MTIPDKTAANLKAIAGESTRWRATGQRYRERTMRGALDPKVTRRAQFAEEVLASIGEMVRLGACCSVIAETSEGRFVGALSYGMLPPHEAAINLLAIDPEHLTGSPGGEQLRGVGTAMVAATSREFLKAGTDTVFLHPLDEQAAKFWQGRGFGVCGRNLLCVRGRKQIDALIDGCEHWPGCGESAYVVCGLASRTEAVRLPQLR